MKQSYSTARFVLALAISSFPFFANAQCISCGTGIDGAYVASSSTTLAGGTYNFTSFTINTGVMVTVTGSAPLVINCTGNVQIDGILNASGGTGGNGVTFSTYGTGGVAVAGGHNGGDGVFIGSGAPGVNGSGTGYGTGGLGWSGGGGAGYAAVGMNSGGSGGTGGVIYSNGQLVPLDGGSGGGGGSGGNNCGSGGGGAGGGIITISSCGTITIGATGSIVSNGGNGGSDGGGNCGSGAGGSGGTIWLSAASFVNNGAMSATGGVGGSTTISGPPYYGTGGTGSVGRIRVDATVSGSGTSNPAIGYTASPLAGTVSSTNVLCNGGSNGSATVTATGGTGPYTYMWSPSGGSAATATGLSATTYSCTITDASSCVFTVTVTITQPAVLSSSAFGTNTSCFGSCDGTAICSPTGGTAPYTYMWSPSGGSNGSASGLCAAMYTVTVTDANGCTSSSTVTITEPTAIVPNVTTLQNPCNGMCIASANANPSGGTAPYTVTPLSNLCAGNYTLDVTDANGCVSSTPVTITDPAPLAASPSVVSEPTCFGSCDAVVNENISGGTAAYSFMWAPSNPTCSGTYTLNVTDANGCSTTGSVSVTDPQPVFGNVMQQNDVTCNGACNGAATIIGSGGTAPYAYSWSPSGCTASSCTNLCAGDYVIDVIDNNGCPGQVMLTISEPTAVVATAASTDASTSTSNDGTLTGSASGGTPGYIYTWQPGNLSGANQTNVGTGTYTLTACDANGCCDTAVVMVADIGSVQNAFNSTNVSIYPNPAAYEINIQIDHALQLDIYDAVGKLVSSEMLKEGVNAIDVSQYANGIYSFRFTSNGAMISKKITITH